MADVDLLVASPPPTTELTTSAPPIRNDRWMVACAFTVTLAVLVPFVLVVVQRWGHPYLPVQDQAVIDLRVRDVWSFSANTPLTGPYSRFGWDHPGPLMYYLLAPFSGVFGEAAWATLVGNCLLQVAAVLWVARLSWKTGRLRWLLPWMAIVGLSYRAIGSTVLENVWNPNVAFPFFILFLLLSVLVSTGDRKQLLGFVFVGSFLVQCHIGYLPLVLIIGGWALVRFSLTARRMGRAPRWWSCFWRPLALCGVLWFVPVVLDTLLNFPGNIVKLFKFVIGAGQTQPILGLSHGLGLLAVEFRWFPPWLGGPDRLAPLSFNAVPGSPYWLLTGVSIIGLAWWRARSRRGSQRSQRSVEMLAVALLAGCVAMTALRGDPTPYLFYWRTVLGAATMVLCLCVIAGTLAGASGVVRHWLRKVTAIAMLTCVGVSTVATTSGVASASGPVSPMEPIAASFFAQLRREGQPRGAVLVLYVGTALGGLEAGVVDQLDRQGTPVYVDSSLGYQFGDGRAAVNPPVRSVWEVTEQSQYLSLLSHDPGARVLAETHPLRPPQQARLVALQRKLNDDLTAAGRTDLVADLDSPFAWLQMANVPGIAAADLAQLSRLNERVSQHYCLCAIVSFPASR